MLHSFYNLGISGYGKPELIELVGETEINLLPRGLHLLGRYFVLVVGRMGKLHLPTEERWANQKPFAHPCIGTEKAIQG